jgi:hypothetical protein
VIHDVSLKTLDRRKGGPSTSYKSYLAKASRPKAVTGGDVGDVSMDDGSFGSSIGLLCGAADSRCRDRGIPAPVR